MQKKDYMKPQLGMREFLTENILAGSDPRGDFSTESYGGGTSTDLDWSTGSLGN